MTGEAFTVYSEPRRLKLFSLVSIPHGSYRFFVTYQTSDGEWVTCVPTEAGCNPYRRFVFGPSLSVYPVL